MLLLSSLLFFSSLLPHSKLYTRTGPNACARRRYRSRSRFVDVEICSKSTTVGFAWQRRSHRQSAKLVDRYTYHGSQYIQDVDDKYWYGKKNLKTSVKLILGLGASRVDRFWKIDCAVDC